MSLINSQAQNLATSASQKRYTLKTWSNKMFNKSQKKIYRQPQKQSPTLLIWGEIKQDPDQQPKNPPVINPISKQASRSRVQVTCWYIFGSFYFTNEIP